MRPQKAYRLDALRYIEIEANKYCNKIFGNGKAYRISWEKFICKIPKDESSAQEH